MFFAIKAAALNEALHIPLTYTRSLHDDGEVWNADSMCGLVIDSDGFFVACGKEKKESSQWMPK